MMVLGILQARMNSTRLPGKVLEPIEGMPMIGRQIERLRRSKEIDELILATSDEVTDDVLVEYVESLGIKVIRGSRDDVLARFIQVIDSCSPDVVVRLTADCPLTSPLVIDNVIREFKEQNLDYLSNTLSPTFPDGLDVEVVLPEVLRWAAANSQDSHEHEHVTLGVYRRPELFKVGNFTDQVDRSDLRWTVDNPQDLAFVREVYRRLYSSNPAFEYADALALLDNEPTLHRTTADAARNAALEGLDTGAMNKGNS